MAVVGVAEHFGDGSDPLHFFPADAPGRRVIDGAPDQFGRSGGRPPAQGLEEAFRAVDMRGLRAVACVRQHDLDRVRCAMASMVLLDCQGSSGLSTDTVLGKPSSSRVSARPVLSLRISVMRSGTGARGVSPESHRRVRLSSGLTPFTPRRPALAVTAAASSALESPERVSQYSSRSLGRRSIGGLPMGRLQTLSNSPAYEPSCAAEAASSFSP
ncbi:hypothetical protein DVK44_16605 [Streptomyces paludis]|uniref:Uncharacterized protein n=1 Tax=Streptomyces paludis TaxID=2282738 RepID=A0A345HQR9_9ACTN|nr:hypothetical protein DVK44_16605 [Streptomyces paludis]